MMKKKRKIILNSTLLSLFVITLTSFTDSKNEIRTVEEINVVIKNQKGIFLIDKFEVIDLMTKQQADYVIGVEKKDLNLRLLETRIKVNPFVKDAQVYLNLAGKLQVKIKQRKPIARIFIDGIHDKYIDKQGNILPINAKHTARVLIIKINTPLIWENNLRETNYGEKLFNLIKTINEDIFWNAHIASLTVKKDGEIYLYPQVTKQVVEWGLPENNRNKFNKLMTAYKKILPKKGWNTYSKINLKLYKQIVCK